MGTLTKDKEAGGESGATSPRAAMAGSPAVPGRPTGGAGRPPPQYPQAPRRPPAMPPASSGGGPSGPGPRPTATAGEGGFFHIYKKGQGYWTRMGTVAGAALIGTMTVQFIWGERATFNLTDSSAVWVCGALALVFIAFAFFILNKPKHVDFLIATDSEMKKVNWTSQKDLVGSTRVVILFMFAIAIFLFVMDIFFGYFFYLIGVLKEPPF
jgi:preprotein translocase SecE subunit